MPPVPPPPPSDRAAIVSRGCEPSSSAKAKFPRSRASTHHAARAGPLNPSRPTCGIIARSFSAPLEFYVLDFLISPAFAQQAATTPPTGLLAAFCPLLFMIPLFFFLVIRPQGPDGRRVGKVCVSTL